LIRLSSNLMAIDGDGAQAFRLGGDEFCVIVDGEGPEREELVARATVALTEHGEGFSVSASHGVVDRSEATNPEDLLHIADRRMYARKAARGSGDLHSREVILRMLEARAPELLQHRDELAQLAERIARVMNLDESTVALARLAAELHDVGKIAIPDSILCKAGPLTDEEWAFIQRHSEAGERILDAAPALTPVARLVRAHHERWDGHGYPDGIAGQDIPIEARIARASRP
jgi:HD-GYP domain-containing protein (c-di-GMP phosphodiesterase class II)